MSCLSLLHCCLVCNALQCTNDRIIMNQSNETWKCHQERRCLCLECNKMKGMGISSKQVGKLDLLHINKRGTTTALFMDLLHTLKETIQMRKEEIFMFWEVCSLSCRGGIQRPVPPTSASACSLSGVMWTQTAQKCKDNMCRYTLEMFFTKREAGFQILVHDIPRLSIDGQKAIVSPMFIISFDRMYIWVFSEWLESCCRSSSEHNPNLGLG